MKTRYLVSIVLLMSCIIVYGGHGQTRDQRLRTRGYINPQEIVSLDSTMRMDQALLVLSELAKQFAGKVIIDLEKRKNPIGVYIVNQHWRDALDMILAHNGLTSVEEPDFIRIVPLGANIQSMAGTGGGQAPTEPPPTLDSRDVKISAVFFSTNLTKLQEYGISWNFFRSKSKEPAITGYLATGIGRGDTASRVPPVAGGIGGVATGPSLQKAIGVIQSPPEFRFANIDALVKFFGSTGMGEVITSPDVIVRDGKKGRIQVGKDIFVTTRDIAGNTINQQISTGTIIDVVPTVYSQSDTDFVWLDMTIEQSDVSPGPEINRTQVKTHALLYDGEETVIGGLVNTLEQEERDGIPFLKDLPWWFLGLRYIFGSESKTRTKNELIVLLKVELSDPIRDRMVHRRTEQELINNRRAEYSKQYDKK